MSTLKGNQKVIARAAPPFNRITKADFMKLKNKNKNKNKNGKTTNKGSY